MLVRSGSFVLLWIVLLPIYRSLHPLKITALNGPNAIKGTTTCQHAPLHLPDGNMPGNTTALVPDGCLAAGPSGYSTGCREVPGGLPPPSAQSMGQSRFVSPAGQRQKGFVVRRSRGGGRGLGEGLLAAEAGAGSARPRAEGDLEAPRERAKRPSWSNWGGAPQAKPSVPHAVPERLRRKSAGGTEQSASS